MPAALVTGSAKGIGKALVSALAAVGYDVAIHYHRSYEAAQALREALAGYGVRAVALQADVTKLSEAQALVDAAHAEFGRLDVLINNVGNYHKGPLSELDATTWHAMLESNLHASFYTCQRAIPIMRTQRYGRIINLGYAGAEQLVARPQVAAYAIAKTGVILYSKALALENAAYGITVNVVSPGVLENSVSKPLNELPMGRTGTLAELSSAVMYLLSDGAAYTTGITLEVAGGWHL
jgi:NAD(P)-dependent dehydrogenase (short-subunit alcohol dehydrogenase family)